MNKEALEHAAGLMRAKVKTLPARRVATETGPQFALAVAYLLEAIADERWAVAEKQAHEVARIYLDGAA